MSESIQTQQLLLDTFHELMSDLTLTVDDDLSARGLDSLQSVAGAMLLRKKGLKISPQDIRDKRCIRDLASFVQNDAKEPTTPNIAGSTGGTYSMTPTQRDWNAAGFSEHYNIYGAWEYDNKTLDTVVLSKAVRLLIDTQEELRLKITRDDGELAFTSSPPGQGPALETVDYSHLNRKDAKQKAIEYCDDLQTSFLFDGISPLCKFVNFIFDRDGGGWLFVVVHHFTVDGLGWGNLLRKLSHIYECLTSNETVDDVYGGSGLSRDWSRYLETYGKNATEAEIDYWRSLPWEELDHDLSDSRLSTGTEPDVELFNRVDAEKLHNSEYGKKLSDDEARDLFSSQATVVKYLDTTSTKQLLDRSWHGAKEDAFDDFDLFAAAASLAVSAYSEREMLWLDMLAATRAGVCPDIDASGSLGYFSELTPFAAPLHHENGLRGCASSIAAFRLNQPSSGIGLRSMKTYNEDPAIRSVLEGMSLPQVGINYHASLLYHFTGSMLDLPKVPFWLGPTLDENGIRYRFWFRVSLENGRLEVVLRYDPERYFVEDGLSVVEAVAENLRSFLTQ